MVQKPKGTYDVIGEKGKEILYLEKLLTSLMEKYNYQYIRTPIFENSELFHRGVGETTDIVTKETYDFKDRSDRNMTLRPEGTAGVVRSFIENKMYATETFPSKNWYLGPMYRYERPQAGRFREFYQFGVEVFGADSAMMDAEVISIPVTFYKLLGLKGVKVKINTLGDNVSRENYHRALIQYFEPYIEDMCEDCKARFLKNPLRILDCKKDSHKDYMKSAPKIIDYLNSESKVFFENVCKYLDALEIDYEIDTSIVRGLDYYTHTVFEVEANIKGNACALCGGGRYNHLVENIGGPSTPGVGFALGFERLISVLEEENIELCSSKAVDVYVFANTLEENKEVFAFVQMLRMNGFSADTDYMDRKYKANFNRADRLGAKYIAIIGKEEVENHFVTFKDNQTKEEYHVHMENVISFLDERIEEEE